MIGSLVAVLPFIAAVFAQSVNIGLPSANQSVSSGDSFIVQVQRQRTLSASEEVAVVIGLQSCPSSTCMDPSDNMGTILYNGPFNPQSHEPELPPYQNFTVQVPSSAAQGTASVGIAHVMLLGAGRYPWLETLNQTITIA